MRRLVSFAAIQLIILSLFIAIPHTARAQQSTSAQKQKVNNSATPRVSVENTPVKIYTIQTESWNKPVYTDYKGCVVRTYNTDNSVIIADSAMRGKVIQSADVSAGRDGNGDGAVTYSGKRYDLTRGLDLINRQCGAMIKSLPDSAIRSRLSKLLVK